MENFTSNGMNDKILFLGEGNFSFSANYIQNLMDENVSGLSYGSICATCYQGLDEDVTQIRKQNISFLKESGANVLFGVDATQIHEHPALRDIKFNKIVFMFPHVGGKMKIHLNRNLLSGIFSSAKHVLQTSGKLLITLCAGQGGTPFESKQRRHDDTWKILQLSQDQGFCLSEIFNFPSTKFTQYSQVGYRSLQKGFNIQDSIVHVFQQGPSVEFRPIDDISDSDSDITLSIENLNIRDGVKQLYPLTHLHHLSFWCPNNKLISLKELENIGKLCLVDIVQSIKLIDHFTNQEGEISQTIEVKYTSLVYPIGPTKCFDLHYNVFGKSIVNIYRVRLR